MRAYSRERAEPSGRARPSLPLPESPPLTNFRDIIHGVLRQWRAGARGGLGAGAPARSGAFLPYHRMCFLDNHHSTFVVQNPTLSGDLL